MLASSSLFVGNNSGPMNLIFALGRPAIILNGPSTEQWDPFWFPERVRMLRQAHLHCQPCDSIERPAFVCSNQEEKFACLHRWSVDEVWNICEEWQAKWDHLSGRRTSDV
jgi:ADP-heptose:LPS heptosyltransferase